MSLFPISILISLLSKALASFNIRFNALFNTIKADDLGISALAGRGRIL
ncbi:MAG: hypothetical protein ACJAVI_001241 [Candidatus Azotimanducaceae bacterium]|jgi:hypothetical protein